MRERVQGRVRLAARTWPRGRPRPRFATLPAAARRWAQSLAADPGATDVAAIKSIEARTKHDVKAVEYWIRGELKLAWRPGRAARMGAFRLHLGGYQQSRYALMLKRARDCVRLPALGAIGELTDDARASATRTWACSRARTVRRRRRPPSARSSPTSPRASSASAGPRPGADPRQVERRGGQFQRPRGGAAVASTGRASAHASSDRSAWSPTP